MKLAGCYTALITPFRNGQVDFDALGVIVEQQIAGGVAGLVPVGTTGESPTLTYREHDDVIKFVTEKANKRCQIIAGTGGNSTFEAIHLPYYNKPTPEGLYRHFSMVAEESGLPIVLYNVPGRTGREIPVDIVARLSKHKLVAAIKEAGGSVERVNAIKDACDITVLSGDDSLTLPMMAVGASGIISVASNIIPAEVSKMAQAALDGDFATALAIHRKYYPLYRDLFIESNPIPIKAAMADLGMIAEEYRLPLCEMTATNRDKLRATLSRVGLLTGKDNSGKIDTKNLDF